MNRITLENQKLEEDNRRLVKSNDKFVEIIAVSLPLSYWFVLSATTLTALKKRSSSTTWEPRSPASTRSTTAMMNLNQNMTKKQRPTNEISTT